MEPSFCLAEIFFDFGGGLQIFPPSQLSEKTKFRVKNQEQIVQKHEVLTYLVS